MTFAAKYGASAPFSAKAEPLEEINTRLSALSNYFISVADEALKKDGIKLKLGIEKEFSISSDTGMDEDRQIASIKAVSDYLDKKPFTDPHERLYWEVRDKLMEVTTPPVPALTAPKRIRALYAQLQKIWPQVDGAVTGLDDSPVQKITTGHDQGFSLQINGSLTDTNTNTNLFTNLNAAALATALCYGMSDKDALLTIGSQKSLKRLQLNNAASMASRMPNVVGMTSTIKPSDIVEQLADPTSIHVEYRLPGSDANPEVSSLMLTMALYKTWNMLKEQGCVDNRNGLQIDEEKTRNLMESTIFEGCGPTFSHTISGMRAKFRDSLVKAWLEEMITKTGHDEERPMLVEFIKLTQEKASLIERDHSVVITPY